MLGARAARAQGFKREAYKKAVDLTYKASTLEACAISLRHIFNPRSGCENKAQGEARGVTLGRLLIMIASL
jgi:hypothetical protein